MNQQSNAPSTALTVPQALDRLRRGEMILVTDDAGRENEGDLIMAAEKVTPRDVNFILTHGRGLLCQAITREQANRLDLPPMTPDDSNTSAHTTAFTVSVDAAGKTTTGISAADRAATIQTLACPAARPEHLLRPGHIFPLTAQPGGVLRRPGHTEAAVELPLLAGLAPTGILCEVLAPSGEPARRPQLEALAAEHGLGILAIKDLIEYRRRTAPPGASPAEHTNPAGPPNPAAAPTVLADTRLPTPHGTFRLLLFSSGDGPGREDLALLKEADARTSAEPPPLVRIHSECLTGETLGSLRCDCGPQLHQAQELIGRQGGILIYLRQEGRGIGLADKLRAYALQDTGADTVEANLRLGHPADQRTYGRAAAILQLLGRSRVRLLTNNPLKVQGLEKAGITIDERIPLEIPPQEHSAFYLKTKKTHCGHHLELA